MIQPYINSEYNIRKYYKYKFVISEYAEGNPIFSPDKYFRVQEKLDYKKLYISSDKFSNEFKIGFFIEENELDNALKNENYLFREDLIIDKEELNELVNMNEDQKRHFVQNVLKLKVFIDSIEAKLVNVCIDNMGIKIDMLGKATNSNEISVEVGFQMPMLKAKGKLFASISEPTYSPNIELLYPNDKMNVTMIPFLNGNISSQDAMHYDGMCEVLVHDEWLLPMSGVTFIIDTENNSI